MKDYSSEYIRMEESVNLTKEDIQEAEKLENDPRKMLALIDLMFLNEDRSKIIPS